MASEAPPFWWQPVDWRARVLAPASWLYGIAATRMMAKARREKVELPVLCVGNFTVGGTGKTPVAIALANHAKKMQLNPGFLSRGHGGSFSEPHVVDAEHDAARHVGDEPLLLAAHAPVAVSPNRAAGARLLKQKGCDFLIMDDGFQSARIHIDYALLVVDARYGLGNGRVIPGGPLRAPLLEQLRFADALLNMGEGSAGDAIVRKASRAGKAVLEAVARPTNGSEIAGKRFLAFAGIGHPDKFYDSVAQAGGIVALTRSFADHHFYGQDDLSELAAAAGAGELQLVTTAKDFARLRHANAPQPFLDRLHVLEIETVFDPAGSPARIIENTLDAWRVRRDSRKG